jgi:hypothetical protein
MKTKTLIPTVLLALGLGGHGCAALAQDGEWVSYRDAYKAMVVFAKYGKPKNLLQMHYQLSPRDAGTSLDGVSLSLNGKTVQLNLPLDPTGRTSFPLLKAAYDENAVLALNRKASLFYFQPRLSLLLRADGAYEAGELRAACEQALQYQRYVNASYGARKCVGVRFVYAKKAEAQVQVRDGGRETLLPSADGAAFEGEAGAGFRTVTYRFADWPERGQVVAHFPPLALAPLFD